jgi:hypothetical protein
MIEEALVTIREYDVISFDETAWKQEWIVAGYEEFFNEQYKKNHLMNPELSKQTPVMKDGKPVIFLLVPYENLK